MENEPQNPQNIQEPTNQPVVEPVPTTTQHSMRNVVLGVSLVLLLAAIAGLWYWFKIYQKPVVNNNTPTPIVEEEIETPQGNIFFLTHQAPTEQEQNDSISTVTVYNYDGTASAPKQIGDSNQKFQGTIFGATTKKLYYIDSGSIQEFDIASKKSKQLIEIRPKFNLIKASLSPDKSKIFYSENCLSECMDDTSISVTNIKIYNIADNSVKTLSESKGTIESVVLVGDRWINNNQIILREYSEGGRLPPLKEITVLNATSGQKTTVALENELYVKSADVSPDGKMVAYSSATITDKGDNNYEYINYLKIKNIATQETRTIRTSSKDFTEGLAWTDNENLLASNYAKSTLYAGPGGYTAEGGTFSVMLVPVNDFTEDKIKKFDSHDRGDGEISFFNEDIMVLSQNLSETPNGVYKENYSHYVYNFKDGRKKIIAENSVRWTFLK